MKNPNDQNRSKFLMFDQTGRLPASGWACVMVKIGLTILFFALAPPVYAQVKAVVGGTLIHPESSAAIEDSVILIESGRIVKVAGKSDAVPVPEGAEVIDAAGKWIIPGLIDSHVHFFLSGGLYTRPDIIDLRKYRAPEEELSWIRKHLPDTFARYIRSGVTSVVDTGGPIDNFKVRELAAKTGPAPRVSAAGPLLSTYLPEELDIEPQSIIEVDSPEEARAEVRRQARWNPDFIKIWFIIRPDRQPEDAIGWVKAAIEESHRLGIRTAVHATELQTGPCGGGSRGGHSGPQRRGQSRRFGIHRSSRAQKDPLYPDTDGYRKI